eukprot:9490492-Pyramimonas_sp.AAC.1
MEFRKPGGSPVQLIISNNHWWPRDGAAASTSQAAKIGRPPLSFGGDAGLAGLGVQRGVVGQETMSWD